MRKVAFLVANDTFPEDPDIPPLRFTQNDAKVLKDVLEDPETCGFETKVYLNETSQRILIDLERISKDLSTDDTLLFYYSGHGRLRGNELCLVSKETTTSSLGATSIPAREVLIYLQESRARRRVLIFDCCYSGAIGPFFRGGDAESALAGLAHGFGSYILTATTAIQPAEERETDGHGVFTKALIDCLREGGKESITVDDWYDYAYDHLRRDARQTPEKCGLRQEGPSFEIGNFKAKHERERQRKREQLQREHQLERERLELERQRERERLISAFRTRIGAYVARGDFAEEQAEEDVALLIRDEARLTPRYRRYRDDLIRFARFEASFLEVFGAGHIPRPEPAPQPPEDEVIPPITPPEAPAIDAPLTLFEPPAIGQSATPPEPAIADQFATPPGPTDVDQPAALPEPMYVDQCIALPEPSDVDQPVALPEPRDLDQPAMHPEPPPVDHPVAPPEPPKAPLRSTGNEDAEGGLIWLIAIIGLAVIGFGFFYYLAWNDSSQLKPEYSQARSDSNYQALSDSHGDSGKNVTASPSLNVTASPSLKDWGIEISEGDHRVVVTKVDPGTDVYKLGIRIGDGITYINFEPINTPADVTKILQALKSGGKEPFSVVVNGSGIKFKF